MTPLETLSPASQLALLDREERQAFLKELKPEELAALEYDWTGFWSRSGPTAADAELEGMVDLSRPWLRQVAHRG